MNLFPSKEEIEKNVAPLVREAYPTLADLFIDQVHPTELRIEFVWRIKTKEGIDTTQRYISNLVVASTQTAPELASIIIDRGARACPK